MKHNITKFFTRVAMVAVLGVITAATAWGQITIDFENNALPSGWTNTNDMAVVANPISNTSSTNGSYCLSTNGKASNSLTSGLIENVVSISIDATRTSNNTTNNVYIDFCPNSSFGSNNTQSKEVTVDKSTWKTSTLTLSTPTSGYVRIRRSGGNSTATKYIDNIIITQSSGGSTPTCATPTFSPAAGTYTSAQNVAISTTTQGATIYYTTNGNDPTTSSSVYSTPISISTNTTIKAMAVKTDYENSAVASATYNFISLDHAGTQADPYSVADARTAIDASFGTSGVYSTGIVSEIPTAWSSEYSNITFNFVDNTGDTDFLQAYRCGSGTGVDASQVAVGDIVVVYGNLTKYGSTYEFGQGCQLVSLTHPVVAIAAPTFNPVAGTYASAQNVSISCETAGVSIYYTTDGTEPTSASTPYTGPISVNNVTTIKAIAIKDSQSSTVATATYHICSQNNPYTVTQALAFNEYPANGIYVNGIVSTAPTQNPTNNGELTYFISVDGVAENQLEVFKGKGLNQAAFTAQDDIQVGDIVTIYGNVKIYNSVKEFDTGNYLVYFERPASSAPSITVDPATINATAAETQGTIAVTYNNITDVAAEIVFYTSAAATETTTEPAWLEAELNASNSVDYLIEANTTATARTAYMKVWAYDDELNEVYSDIITITQAAPDYATLPFEYDGGGKETLPNGFTTDGLGTPYGSSPKMKFDGSGDYAILKFNERPGELTFDIKGNSFSGGTFKVQTSADGVTYTDLETYSELGSTQSESFDNLAADVRYIKWIYTNKSSGNVALGNIALAQYEVAPQGSYTVSWTAGANTELFVFAGDESETIENGDEVLAGTTVMVSVDVADGYQFGSLVVTDANNNEVELTAIEPNCYYSFVMPASNVTITSTAVAVTPPSSGEWVLTNLADLTPNDVFVIVGDIGDTYAMSNANGTSNAPSVVAVTVVDNTLSGEVPANIQWTLSHDNAGYIFYPNGSDETWLYCINDNNGVRVGTGDAKHFNLENGYLTTIETSDQRYIGIYSSQDWRCYKNTGGNIAGQTFAFYKKVVTDPAEINLTLTSGDGGFWGTFYNGVARYDLPAGAQAFTMDGTKKLFRLGEGTVIPKGVAVVIIADTADITLTKGADTTVAPSGDGSNILVGSDSPVAKTGTQYVLGKKNGVFGFFKFNGTNIPAGKAYYVISE